MKRQNIVFIACCKLSESSLFFGNYEVLKCFSSSLFLGGYEVLKCFVFWKALKIRKIKISHSWLAVNCQNIFFFSKVTKFCSALVFLKSPQNTRCQNLTFINWYKLSNSFLLLEGYEVLKSLVCLKSPQKYEMSKSRIHQLMQIVKKHNRVLEGREF